MSVYRAEFVTALEVFARASEEVERRGFPRPILVGGAAVELYAGGAVATGDFDVVTPRQEVFEEVLREFGFTRPAGVGHVLSGWIHAGLKLGFEVVGSTLLDGKAERDRIRLIDVSDARRFAVIGIEDLIADRMGQYASGTAPEMLEQARLLLNLYQDIDFTYMDRRIREETSDDYALADLQDRDDRDLA